MSEEENCQESEPVDAEFTMIAMVNDPKMQHDIKNHILGLQMACHGVAQESGWWNDPETGEPLERNKAEMICLMHSELSEAMEAVRKNKMDDHLMHRPGIEVELADCMIRILDYAGGHNLDLGGALAEKLVYNSKRPDHKPENRVKDGGKDF